MPAPTPAARTLPTGKKLGDGFPTLISLKLKPAITFWEKTCKPPGMDGGEPVDNTTMHNVAMRTSAPRKLKTATSATATVAYDPKVLPEIIASINIPDTVTYHFPDRSSWCFYGFLQSFEPGDCAEGAQPEATATFAQTNTDPVDGTEQVPVYTVPTTVLGASGADELLGEAPRQARRAA
jgi:hypothetical protein